MKSLRLWLLLLLAVLVPLRGAIAAALPCGGQGRPAQVEQAHAAAHAQHRHMHHTGQAGEHGDAGKCSPCASCCLGATLPATFSPAIAAIEQAGARFAVLQASAPTFLSDGQDRPPRSR